MRLWKCSYYLLSSFCKKAGNQRGSGTLGRYWPRCDLLSPKEESMWGRDHLTEDILCWPPGCKPPLLLNHHSKWDHQRYSSQNPQQKNEYAGFVQEWPPFYKLFVLNIPSGGTTLSLGFKLKPPVEACPVKVYITFNKIARIIFFTFSQTVDFSAKYKSFSFWCFHLQPQWVSAMIYWLWRRQWRG